tara:strand:+ start:1793 stop:3565 length:1773 start_codon:yes stop_codon:yes gene_type:complete
MAYELWDEKGLREISGNSLLYKMVKSLDIDVDSWIDYAIEELPETLRITKGRTDVEWTRSELIKMGGVPISWMPNESAWQMPFGRGKAPEGYSKRLLSILHDSGRITRQEAASMLPVELLDIKDETIVLDMCAAPGSKTTQVAEKLSSNGFVIANEPISSRANMLISNRARLALTNVLINQQDGRHIGRIPPPGYDAIIADVPCTGSATTRKNRKVWNKWKPRDSRGLFKLQITIAERGARGLIPGGKMVYSTCSIDPIENEAVVAELLRQCPWIELVEIDESILNGLKLRPGLTNWDIMDENCDSVEISKLPELPGLTISHLCPKDRMKIDSECDLDLEEKIAADLLKCRRLYHMDNNTGGFFVAMLRHRVEATPEGVARAYISKRKYVNNSEWVPKIMSVKNESRHSIKPAKEDEILEVSLQYKLDTSKWSWWKRGKRLNIASPVVYDRLYHPMSPNKGGNLWQNDTFHPLKILHVGMPCFVKNKGTWRTRQESIPAVEEHIGDVVLPIERSGIEQLLGGVSLAKEDVLPTEMLDYEGPILLAHQISGSTAMISAWSGTRISLMINTLEKDILRAKLSLPFEHELEEE